MHETDFFGNKKKHKDYDFFKRLDQCRYLEYKKRIQIKQTIPDRTGLAPGTGFIFF